MSIFGIIAIDIAAVVFVAAVFALAAYQRYSNNKSHHRYFMELISKDGLNPSIIIPSGPAGDFTFCVDESARTWAVRVGHKLYPVLSAYNITNYEMHENDARVFSGDSWDSAKDYFESSLQNPYRTCRNLYIKVFTNHKNIPFIIIPLLAYNDDGVEHGNEVYLKSMELAAAIIEAIGKIKNPQPHPEPADGDATPPPAQDAPQPPASEGEETDSF